MNDDRVFAGAVPALYESLMVPLIFAPYADDLAGRAAAGTATQVLEIAAGTGVLTRALDRRLPGTATIVATDLNPAMLQQAESIGTTRAVRWQEADAQQLPFDDASFDLVLCQFGAMFFPDRAGAFAEVRRVLRPGGRFLFNVWDRIETNEFADVVTQALADVFPHDPPRFLARTPHGCHDLAALARELARAGFEAPPQRDTVDARSRAPSGREPAIAYCQGTPLRREIEARGAPGLAAATAAAAAALEARFGPGPVDGRICAHVLALRR